MIDISKLKVYSFLPRDKSTLYFLLQNDVIVYIGLTSRLELRITQHRTDKRQKFNTVRYYDNIDKNDIKTLENTLIDHYKPIYNKSLIRKYISKNKQTLFIKYFELWQQEKTIKAELVLAQVANPWQIRSSNFSST